MIAATIAGNKTTGDDSAIGSVFAVATWERIDPNMPREMWNNWPKAWGCPSTEERGGF